MKVAKIRHEVLKVLAADVQRELTRVTARNTKSLFRDSSLESVQSFSWDAAATELETQAPLLTAVLRGIVCVKRRVRVRKLRRRKKQASHRPSDTAVLCICAAIMLRHRNVHMNMLQRIVSLILYNGHASKQVCKRLMMAEIIRLMIISDIF